MGEAYTDDAKLAEAILYVARQLADDPSGGATKLNKVLFFAEFAHMRAYGRPITGAEYQKLAYGPAPRRLVPVRRSLVESGAAEERESTYFGRIVQRLVAMRPAAHGAFEASELAALDEAIELLAGQTAGAASDFSHQEPGWQMVEEGETIPYETAFLRESIVTDFVRRRIRQLASERAV